ncbi:MAG: VWA domain-containing protein [Vicinamibacterales bacterium]
MRPSAIVVPLAIAATVSIAAQSPVQKTSTTPVFRSGVDLVRFDVRVTDSAGHPIANLRPDELQIVENGKVLPLVLFQHIEEPAGLYAQAALRAVSAEVTTNAGAPRGHLYLFLFDQAHIATGDEQVARRAAETFIKTRLRPSDRIAIIGLPGPGPALGFTADQSRAIAELTKIHGDLETTVTSSIGNMSLQEAYQIAAGDDRVLESVLERDSTDPTTDVGGGQLLSDKIAASRITARPPEDPAAVRQAMIENARTVVAQADQTTRDLLQRLVDVLEQYRGVEGRKIVVFFSEGFHQSILTNELERAEAAAADSYSVFYAFDLNHRSDNIAQADVSTADPSTEIQARLAPLGSLAVATDGSLIVNAASHVDQALDRIADQAQDYYLVGFTPSAAARADRGSYRRVTVRVTRPGARVSARTGYAAPKPVDTLNRRGAIDEALAAPFAEQALHIDYTTYVMRSTTPNHARVLLALDANLPVRDAGHRSADVVFLVRDARDGHVAASGTDTMPLPSAASPGSALGRSTFRVQFDIPPGSYLMRTVVREPGGLIGSADRRFEVRPLSGPDVAVSDLLLGSDTGALPVRAHAYTGSGLAGVVEAYGRAPNQLGDVKATVSLLPENSDRPSETVAADVGQTEQDAAGGVLRRVDFTMPLASVAPGSYIARVAVTAGSETVADVSREVDVSAGTAPSPTPSAADVETVRPAEILNGDFVRPARAAVRSQTTPAARHEASGFEAFAGADYAGAAAELSAALTLDQTNGAVAFVLGWAYESQGDHRDAISAWRAAAADNPKMIPAHLALADAYLRLGQPALAVQVLNAGLTAVPQSIELKNKLAQVQKGG